MLVAGYNKDLSICIPPNRRHGKVRILKRRFVHLWRKTPELEGWKVIRGGSGPMKQSYWWKKVSRDIKMLLGELDKMEQKLTRE